MRSISRMILVAMALLTSGALQVAAAAGDDACCEQKGAPCRDCPPGLVCACCPARGAVQAAIPEVAPVATPGVVMVVAGADPNVAAPASDIFQPPRA